MRVPAFAFPANFQLDSRERETEARLVQGCEGALRKTHPNRVYVSILYVDDKKTSPSKENEVKQHTTQCIDKDR